MKKTQALQAFWSKFGIPAYQEASVPDNAPFPRITYQNAAGFFEDQLALSASVWYRQDSWADVEEKASEIADYIGLGGAAVPFEGGLLWINRGSPFSQSAPVDPFDDLIRRKILNITAEFITAV